MPANFIVTSSLELLAAVLSHLDWYGLCSSRQVSRTWRRATQHVIRGRVSHALEPFLEANQVTQFFHLLDDHGGVVVGSVARHAVVMNRSWNFSPPNDLNVVVAPGHTDDVMHLLSEFNYICWRPDTVPRHLKPHVEEPVFRGFLHGEPDHPSMTVASAKFSPLKTVLSSIWSHQINLITSWAVFAFYPSWTLQNVSLRGDMHEGDSYYPHDDSIACYDSNMSFPLPCGRTCPGITRRIMHDTGVSIMAWGTDEASFSPSDHDGFLTSVSISHRLRAQCHNGHCTFFTPPPIR
ncbi:hypothetical protein BKA70DRAFT_1447163 [Coprinopsis sp. MPI-PUGE-AT-0042]|nr:hypothetical protein BKA70DRAFT_1447163 [Coprinopsis sp. MPI-PUGE-AT-0042]